MKVSVTSAQMGWITTKRVKKNVVVYRKHLLQRVGHRTWGWNPNGHKGSGTLGIFIFISCLLAPLSAVVCRSGLVGSLAAFPSELNGSHSPQVAHFTNAAQQGKITNQLASVYSLTLISLKTVTCPTCTTPVGANDQLPPVRRMTLLKDSK